MFIKDYYYYIFAAANFPMQPFEAKQNVFRFFFFLLQLNIISTRCCLQLLPLSPCLPAAGATFKFCLAKFCRGRPAKLFWAPSLLSGASPFFLLILPGAIVALLRIVFVFVAVCRQQISKIMINSCR